jgi:Ser/Thr protein kinase RdoA (MazF antagonist)
MTEPSSQTAPSGRAPITTGAADGVLAAASNVADPVAGPGASPGGQLLLRRSVARQGGRLPATAVDEPALFPVLEAAYDLGRWRDWRRTARGTSNISWFVRTDAGEVVLRRSHNLKSVAGAEFECALIDHLRGHGYPAPPVQRTREGAILVEVEGVLHMVMRLMPGQSYDPGDAAQLEAVATGLGRYHSIVSELTLPADRERSSSLASLGQQGQENLYAAVDVVEPLLAADAGATLREHARYLAERMERVNVGLGERQKDLTFLVIHGSYGQSAVLVDEGRLTAVLDFDRSAQDLLGLDLAYALRSFCREGPIRRSGFGIDPDRCRTFLHHYRNLAPLAEADLAAMPDVFQAQRLIVIVKKCENLLTKQAIVPRQPKDAAKFALMLERECNRVRWFTDNPITLTEDT